MAKTATNTNMTENAFPQHIECVIENQFGLTKREYAAIHLLVDDSGDPQLDAMIRKARRMELAGKAMQGNLENPELIYSGKNSIGEFSVEFADALLARLEVDDEQSVSETKKGV